MQMQSISDFRKLPQERIEKANPHRQLIFEEGKHLAKLSESTPEHTLF